MAQKKGLSLVRPRGHRSGTQSRGLPFQEGIIRNRVISHPAACRARQRGFLCAFQGDHGVALRGAGFGRAARSKDAPERANQAYAICRRTAVGSSFLRNSLVQVARTSFMDLSMIIVGWNARHYLELCLESLESAPPRRNMEVIVLDNASSDGSAEMIESR